MSSAKLNTLAIRASRSPSSLVNRFEEDFLRRSSVAFAWLTQKMMRLQDRTAAEERARFDIRTRGERDV